MSASARSVYVVSKGKCGYDEEMVVTEKFGCPINFVIISFNCSLTAGSKVGPYPNVPEH